MRPPWTHPCTNIKCKRAWIARTQGAMNQVILGQNGLEERLAQLARLGRWQDKQVGEKGDISAGNGASKCKYLAVLFRNIEHSSLKDVTQVRWDIARQRQLRIIEQFILIKHLEDRL